MKVSVVMPTYNRAYVIRDAIESALGQTYRDFELIVVDDGSSDITGGIVEQLAAGAVRYIRHARNRGYSAACNTGVSAAAGELVAFLDSDDIWKPEYLERQVGFMSRHPEVDAVFSDTEIHEDKVIPSLARTLKVFSKLLETDPGADEYVFTSRQMYVCLLEEVPIKPTAFVVKRGVLGRAGLFDEAWPSGTDWDLLIRMSRVACFGYIHLPLVVQRRTGDATHQKFREQDKLFLLNVFMKEKKGLRNDLEARRAIDRGILGHCNNLGYHYLSTAQRMRALGVYLRGFREARDPKMLARALAVLMPSRTRRFIKGIARKADLARV